jgi:(S)-2-hydroxy-acid oxidase
MSSNPAKTMTDERVDYYNEGAMDLITYAFIQDIDDTLANLGTYSLKDNEAAFNRYKIRPRVLVNVAKIDLETEIFGVKVKTDISRNRFEQC